MKIDYNPRLSYEQYMTVQTMYQRRRPIKPVETPCIKPVSQIEGSRFDVRG